MSSAAPRLDERAARPLIHGLLRDELVAVCRDLGQPAYRAAQLWHWLYIRGSEHWSDFKNVPKALTAALAERFILQSVETVASQGTPESTRKYLVRLPDGEQVEEVLIPARDRRTVCVSSQAGCKFHCAFCASGQAGFRRHLHAGEMVGEVLLAARVVGTRPSHVVFMGIGEPLDNYDAVLRAIRIINDPDGLGIGARRITISTCGVVPGIDRLAGEGVQVELSVSLHAPNDALRSKLMPVNRTYPLPRLIETCRGYSAKTNRIITFEYTLIRDINDRAEQARELARLLAKLPCRVNLIPLSPVDEFQGAPSTPQTAAMFIEVLARAGLNATLRASKGSALRAACGQLRYRRPDST